LSEISNDLILAQSMPPGAVHTNSSESAVAVIPLVPVDSSRNPGGVMTPIGEGTPSLDIDLLVTGVTCGTKYLIRPALGDAALSRKRDDMRILRKAAAMTLNPRAFLSAKNDIKMLELVDIIKSTDIVILSRGSGGERNPTSGACGDRSSRSDIGMDASA
jgi:hypothetical protein